jgi:SAM-dependent methyltransferase
MRIGAIGESALERLAILLRLGPRPLLETHGTLLLAQAIMVATKRGVFEALAAAPLTPDEVASRCGTDGRATGRLLGVLEATGYLRALPDARFALTSDARRWLLAESPHSLHDNVLFRFVEWEWIGRLDQFVRTGAPLDIHAEMSPEQWDAYQRGMRSLAGAFAREVVLRTPIPKGARSMLDIGGSHGFFSVALCRRYPGLRAEVLDLPGAVAQAAPILAREGLGDRVTHRAGDALNEDFGTETFDLIFVSNLVHHFAPEQGRDLVRRAARALRPAGILVIQELFALSSGRRAGQIAALADLYFALTSESGTLSVDELAAWQREAGLRPRRPIRFVSFPGAGQQNAVKPR